MDSLRGRGSGVDTRVAMSCSCARDRFEHPVPDESGSYDASIDWPRLETAELVECAVDAAHLRNPDGSFHGASAGGYSERAEHPPRRVLFGEIIGAENGHVATICVWIRNFA